MSWEVAQLKILIWSPTSDYKATHFVKEDHPMMPQDAIANKSASIHKVSGLVEVVELVSWKLQDFQKYMATFAQLILGNIGRDPRVFNSNFNFMLIFCRWFFSIIDNFPETLNLNQWLLKINWPICN